MKQRLYMLITGILYIVFSIHMLVLSLKLVKFGILNFIN